MTDPTTTWRADTRDTTIRALRDMTDRHPDAPLVSLRDRSLSYGEFLTEVNRLAHGLADVGVRAGDTVATMLDNNAEALVSWFAVNALGAIYVPLNTALKGEFLRHQLADSDAAVLIAEARYLNRLPVDPVPKLGILSRGTLGDDAFAGKPVNLLAEVYSTDESPVDVLVRPEDLTALYYTAGTTGPAKGCMVSHNFVCHLARETLSVSGRQRHEHQWTPLPLYHMNAPVLTVLASILIGGSATISDRFSVSGFWRDIERSGARFASLLGSMAHLIAEMDDTEEMARVRGQLRVVWAFPFAQADRELWRERFGVELVGAPGYGQTECGFVVSAPLDVPAPPGASGRRTEFFDVRIVDDHDAPLPVGAVGEVVARPLAPDLMFSGYWKNAEATTAAFRNLWYHTGDMGRFDEDGWFYFVDRKKDYIRRRGENISSFELERTICGHPDVVEAAVVAVPSELTEDDVKVIAVLRPGARLSESDLCRWAIDRVPHFAVPRFIEFRSDLPKSEVGRVYKHILRDEASAKECWDREAAGIVVSRD